MPTVVRLRQVLPPARPREIRTSPESRGYNWRWRKVSEAYRRRHPFCVECERRHDRLVYEDVLVDHKYPVADGGPIFPGDTGLWTLCRVHHGWKTSLEAYARQMGQMDQIVRWCDEPNSRPRIGGEML